MVDILYRMTHKILRPKNLPNIMSLVTHSIEVRMCYKQNVRPYCTSEIFTGIAADCLEISVSFNK
jgi:hypothetical protein